MDLEGFRRTVRRNMSLMYGLMVAIFVPFMVLTTFTASSRANLVLSLGLFGGLLLFFGVFIVVLSRRGRTTPTEVLLTNRRILVENFGKGESSASMPLDNLGDVSIESKGSAKAAGVAWVYLLPIGATQAMVGAGRNRQAAPGVVWIPALRTDRAERLKSLALAQARALQSTPR